MVVLFISGSEIFIIGLVVLLLFGSKRIPEIAKGLGKGMKEFKKATDDIKKEFSDSEISKDIKDIKNNIAKSDIAKDIKDIKKGISDVDITKDIRTIKKNLKWYDTRIL